MYFIKALPPKESIASWTHTRFGKEIPKEKTEVETLKKFFDGSPLSEEKLLQALRDDARIEIETIEDHEANIAREEKKAEVKDEPQEVKKIRKNKK